LIAVGVASLVMYFPSRSLNNSFGFGSRELAGAASRADGHTGGWGRGRGYALALVLSHLHGHRHDYDACAARCWWCGRKCTCPSRRRSRASSVGSSALWGIWLAKRRGFNPAQKARVENAGVLTASGADRRRIIDGLGLGWNRGDGKNPLNWTYRKI